MILSTVFTSRGRDKAISLFTSVATPSLLCTSFCRLLKLTTSPACQLTTTHHPPLHPTLSSFFFPPSSHVRKEAGQRLFYHTRRGLTSIKYIQLTRAINNGLFYGGYIIVSRARDLTVAYFSFMVHASQCCGRKQILFIGCEKKNYIKENYYLQAVKQLFFTIGKIITDILFNPITPTRCHLVWNVRITLLSNVHQEKLRALYD